MSPITLNESETKLLNAVIDEMKDMPEVDYAAVAQKVGIKYAKNAKQSFKKVWAKLKSGNGGTAANGNGVDADDANDIDAESPKKPAAKKDVTPKKAPAVKKGVAKATGPKKASGGGPKAAKVPRKTKKQKDEEAAAAAAAAAEAAEQEDSGDEDKDMAEDNEDGKSLNPKVVLESATQPVKFVTSTEAIASNGTPATAGTDEVSVPVMEATPAKGETVPIADAATPATNDASSSSIYVMNDEYEARIREMPLEDWLKWKAESGYTWDLSV